MSMCRHSKGNYVWIRSLIKESHDVTSRFCPHLRPTLNLFYSFLTRVKTTCVRPCASVRASIYLTFVCQGCLLQSVDVCLSLCPSFCLSLQLYTLTLSLSLPLSLSSSLSLSLSLCAPNLFSFKKKKTERAPRFVVFFFPKS